MRLLLRLMSGFQPTPVDISAGTYQEHNLRESCI
ncbi:hypothetical protein NK6_9290 [Bradyrhizobium diazoefficiens]|uniref:Uncharacterized protein n=1 Tax=Bradyrhizobium diazoefficiens TaxID=1355477 RepID=A0A0E4BX88_9BRAD|nr:hypothetical protein NK6_9290 [Bradyrhizobium diazoefficiens]